ETVALAGELALPIVVTNDVHYARPEGRAFQAVLTPIRHGRTLDTLADLRRPDGESYLKSGDQLMALPPGDGSLGRDVARAWSAGIARAADLAAACRVDLGFEQYRFPGFPVPRNETPFSYLSELCWEGARRRYHPLAAAVREVGVALGFPRPLVDRVAKALETYDSVMVRRDLEADGGFAEFFRRPDEGLPAEAGAAAVAEERGLVDGMGQLNKRVPLVGKVPPWRQPPKPADPNAPRPVAWIVEVPLGATAGAALHDRISTQ